MRDAVFETEMTNVARRICVLYSNMYSLNPPDKSHETAVRLWSLW